MYLQGTRFSVAGLVVLAVWHLSHHLVDVLSPVDFLKENAPRQACVEVASVWTGDSRTLSKLVSYLPPIQCGEKQGSDP